MKFIDEAKIYIKSGKGGPGSASFRREKFIPKGGPDGGDGGKGGDAIIVADNSKNTLLHYRYNQHFDAGNGSGGSGSNKNGKDGNSIKLNVPIGTLVYNYETSELLADLNKQGDEYIVAKGGRGGKGNSFFKTATNQAPEHAQPGEPSNELVIKLELKLLSDVGLVGLPNSGKSTLISVVSNSKPKIADYPFTTLVPNLGVVKFDENFEFVMSDIPGLIKDAHLGAGLGINFLKHIERTKIICHCVDVGHISIENPIEDFETVRNELKAFNPQILEKEYIIVLTKTDLLEKSKTLEIEKKFKKYSIPIFTISAVAQIGIQPLIKFLGATCKKV